MKGKKLAKELAEPLRRLSEMDQFDSEDFLEFADELSQQYRAGGIPKDIYEALDDVVDKRYARLRGITTAI